MFPDSDRGKSGNAFSMSPKGERVVPVKTSGVGGAKTRQKGIFTMRTTNIYILADLSYGSARFTKQMQQFIIKANRACQTEPNVQLHIIGFNDKARILSPFEPLRPQGNPNFSSALELLSSIVNYNKKYSHFMTRSIVIWLSSFNVMRGYEGAFYKLNKQMEFSRAIRYTIAYGLPDEYTQMARYTFASNLSGVLDYFSENRLKRLIKQLKGNF